MNKLILIILIFSLNFHVKNKDEVFICGSNGAKKYHLKENCRGFNACKHQVVKKTLKEAKDLGLELCGWED